MWITNSAEAEIFVVFANVDPSKGYKGITCFLVEKDMGIEIAKKEKKLGIRASSTCTINFDDVRVPAANVIGEVGKGYKIAIEILNEGAQSSAASLHPFLTFFASRSHRDWRSVDRDCTRRIREGRQICVREETVWPSCRNFPRRPNANSRYGHPNRGSTTDGLQCCKTQGRREAVRQAGCHGQALLQPSSKRGIPGSYRAVWRCRLRESHLNRLCLLSS